MYFIVPALIGVHATGLKCTVPFVPVLIGEHIPDSSAPFLSIEWSHVTLANIRYLEDEGSFG
jgi:hypothetical protein